MRRLQNLAVALGWVPWPVLVAAPGSRGEAASSGSPSSRTCVLGSKERTAEFRRGCRVAGVSGVSLHSFRYAWAERASA